MGEMTNFSNAVQELMGASESVIEDDTAFKNEFFETLANLSTTEERIEALVKDSWDNEKMIDRFVAFYNGKMKIDKNATGIYEEIIELDNKRVEHLKQEIKKINKTRRKYEEYYCYINDYRIFRESGDNKDRSNLRRWLKEGTEPKRELFRESLFKIAVLMNLNEEETSEMFYKVLFSRAFNVRNVDEMIILWWIRNQEKQVDSLKPLELDNTCYFHPFGNTHIYDGKIIKTGLPHDIEEKLCGSNSGSIEYTSQLYPKPEDNKNLEDFIEWLKNNSVNFKGPNRKAKSLCDGYMKKIEEDSGSIADIIDYKALTPNEKLVSEEARTDFPRSDDYFENIRRLRIWDGDNTEEIINKKKEKIENEVLCDFYGESIYSYKNEYDCKLVRGEYEKDSNNKTALEKTICKKQEECLKNIRDNSKNQYWLRKALIFLQFLRYWKTPNTVEPPKTHDSYLKEINNDLNSSGYSQLLWRNPYDFIFLFCSCGKDFQGNEANPIEILKLFYREKTKKEMKKRSKDY